MNEKWKLAQEWEAEWHSNCINSLNEELKQLVYAEKMGLIRSPDKKTPYRFDLEGRSVLDIGGGAYSLLLKCVNFRNPYVIDPLMDKYPSWIAYRYRMLDIMMLVSTGEEVTEQFPDGEKFDEVWIYNVLEHTYDPKKVIENALQLGNIVRIFEWLDTTTNVGHLHSLKENELNLWLGGEGKVEQVNRNGAVGKCYYGVFKGNNYVASSY